MHPEATVRWGRQRPITLNRGADMTGWYDMATLEAMDQPEDEAGLRDTARCAAASLLALQVELPLP
jgi:hypothetical protein